MGRVSPRVRLKAMRSPPRCRSEIRARSKHGSGLGPRNDIWRVLLLTPLATSSVPLDPARVERSGGQPRPWFHRVGLAFWNGSARRVQESNGTNEPVMVGPVHFG